MDHELRLSYQIQNQSRKGTSMTEKQTKLYWREWAKTRRTLISHGYHSSEVNEQRRELTIQALGARVGTTASSKDLTNRQLDKVLGAFRAVSRPADLNAQLDAEDQPRRRAWFRLRQQAGKAKVDKPYLVSISKQMFGKHIDDCDEDELKRIIVALRYHNNRQEAKKDEGGEEAIARGTGTPWNEREQPIDEDTPHRPVAARGSLECAENNRKAVAV